MHELGDGARGGGVHGRAGETHKAGAAARPMPRTRSRCAVRVHRSHKYSYPHTYA